MKKKQLTQFSAAIAVLFALAPLAHAQISLKGEGSAEVKVGEVVQGQVKAGTNTTISPEKAVLVEGGMNASSHKMMEDGTETMEQKDGHDGEWRGENEDSEDHEAKDGHDMGAMHAEHSLDTLEKAMFRIDLDDAEDGDEEEAATVAVDSVTKVHSSHDFEHFVAHKAKDDKHLKKVEVANGTMQVTYAEPAKLFGFMKTTINARASVDAKDNVEVEYPWYHIFMKKHVSKASLQSSIARAVAAERKGIKEGMATTTIEAKIEASLGIPNLFEIIANALKEASVKAEAEVKAEAK